MPRTEQPMGSAADPEQSLHDSCPPNESVATLPSRRKQSKSRNGCLTCKEKRLKCDETKPQCKQCVKRNIVCQGYKKQFKWRSFEEHMADKKTPAPRRKDGPAGAATNARIDKTNRRPSPSRADKSKSPTRQAAARHAKSNSIAALPASTQVEGSTVDDGGTVDIHQLALRPHATTSEDATVDKSKPTEEDLHEQSLAESFRIFEESCQQVDDDDDGLDLGFDLPFDDFAASLDLTDPDAFAEPNDESSGDDADFCTYPAEFDQFLSDSAYNSGPPSEPDSLWKSITPASWPPASKSDLNCLTLVQSPHLDIGSDELLLQRFDTETCSIMSIHDGPQSNPWRALMVPLVSISPALFHAVCSMAAFHGARSDPQLRHHGIVRFNRSLAILRRDVSSLPAEVSLATSIALAFAESWDSAISTGIDHLRAGKELIQRSWDEMTAQVSPPKPQLERFKFLCRTWIYVDVIARLTSVDDDVSDDFAKCATMLGMESDAKVDPLMGCASSLFPIIGHVANLARRVCNSESNTPAVIDRASKLQADLQRWKPPTNLSLSKDLSSEVQHAQQTAEAYRWATLLYLYQAVPELPSPPSSKLGSKVMKYLATVPLSSRTIITHIYPLLVGGCEATTLEDRNWVSQRWRQMARRMLIANIDRCADVVKEVWRRRDEHAASQVQDWTSMALQQRQDLRDNYNLMVNVRANDLISKSARDMIIAHRDSTRPLRPDFRQVSDADGDVAGSMEREYTVRGSLHWVSVMRDWKWEVLLG